MNDTWKPYCMARHFWWLPKFGIMQFSDACRPNALILLRWVLCPRAWYSAGIGTERLPSGFCINLLQASIRLSVTGQTGVTSLMAAMEPTRLTTAARAAQSTLDDTLVRQHFLLK